MNKENYQKVLDKIKADPSCWRQDSWHCGTKHCFAGWAQILSGHEPNDITVRRDARVFLDLSKIRADYLFGPDTTIEIFEDELKGGYNRAGYDRAGYDRAGYDSDGYDRAGYDRDGYDRDGYDRAGYDRDGLDAKNKPRPE